MEGISCTQTGWRALLLPAAPPAGSLKIKAAEAEGVSPDIRYAHRLLDVDTGIAVVPGSEFHLASPSLTNSWSRVKSFCASFG
jgi:hypothetical protein